MFILNKFCNQLSHGETVHITLNCNFTFSDKFREKNKGPKCLPYNRSYAVCYFDTDICCVQSTEAVGDWRKNIEDKADRKKMFETSWTSPTIKARLMFPPRSSDSLSLCHLTEFKHFGSFSFGSFVDSIQNWEKFMCKY